MRRERVNYSMLIAGENNEVQTFSELMSVKVNDSQESVILPMNEPIKQLIAPNSSYLCRNNQCFIEWYSDFNVTRRFAKKRMDMIALMKSLEPKDDSYCKQLLFS